jgi:hypothetical protein
MSAMRCPLPACIENYADAKYENKPMTMCMQRLTAVLFTMTILIGAGCDDAPTAPPPAPPPAPKEEPRAARPTTQALVSGATKTVPISALPMKITVPGSWEPQDIGGQRLFLMEGYTPSGHVGLSLSTRQQLSPNAVNDFIAAAKKRIDEKGAKKLRFETREFPDFTVLERLWYEDRQELLLRDYSGELRETEAQPAHWSYLIFMKKVDAVDVYELEFTDLTLELFEKDREFLEKVLRSLVNEKTG